MIRLANKTGLVAEIICIKEDINFIGRTLSRHPLKATMYGRSRTKYRCYVMKNR